MRLSKREWKEVREANSATYALPEQLMDRIEATMKSGFREGPSEEDLYAWFFDGSRNVFHASDLPAVLGRAEMDRLIMGLYHDTKQWIVEIPGAWTEVHYRCNSLASAARTIAAIMYRPEDPEANVGHLLGDE